MIRTGIFIGVNRTGNLRELKDAAAGARRMHEWALSQGMENGSHAKLITDDDGKEVTTKQILKAIREIIDGPGADQLILYFAGHGVNINRSEHWLLTDAPVDSSAAIDVRSSVELARYCGIGHTVIISDACRSAPEGIQSQNIRGVDAFPNESASDKANPVDQFFACVLGRTAAEIKNPELAAQGFRALYTDVMLDALKGQVGEVLDSADDSVGYVVKPLKLETYLEQKIPARVRELNLTDKVNQNPDAIIIAHSHWLAAVKNMPRVLRTARPLDQLLPEISIRAATRTLVQTATGAGITQLTDELSQLKKMQIPETTCLVNTVEQVAMPFGPDHFESQCGIKVRGASIEDFSILGANAELLGYTGELLRIDGINRPVSVVLRFKGNFGTVIPALPFYLAALTFEGDELIDVSFEPSVNSPFWGEYASRASEIRGLRGVAASASRQGRFVLDQSADRLGMARKMQGVKGIDPTLAVYAAYAYYDLQEIVKNQEMAQYLRDNLFGATLFDVALLGRLLKDEQVGSDASCVPFLPMLSQGWPLLRANRVRLDPSLDGIERKLRDSLWSLYDGDGVSQLQAAVLSGRVR